jgi:chromate reductase
MPPLANNTLGWLTRPHEENEPPLVAFNGKVAALGAVSPGGLGGIRGLVPLRMMLGNIGVTVVPTQVAINFGVKAFGDDGQLTDDMQAKFLQGTIDEFIKTTDRLSG